MPSAFCLIIDVPVNLPNAITLGRIFLVPLLVVVLFTKFDGWNPFGVNKQILGALIFAVASLTDWLDGYVARRRKQGITHALRDVLRREVERERRKPRRESSEEFHRAIQEIVDEVKKLPVLDDRTPDEILGYNEHGLFD